MSEKKCSLCDLPVTPPAVTDPGMEGVYCCEGCLRVDKLLKEMDRERADSLRRAARDRTGHRPRKQHGQDDSPAEIRSSPGEAEATGSTDEAPADRSEELFLKVDGMHCATCENFLEAVASSHAGVLGSEASYASELIRIAYDPDRIDPGELPGLLSGMGYEARPVESPEPEEADDAVVRLVIGGFFGIVGLLLYALFLYPTYFGGSGLVPLTRAESNFIISNILVMTTVVLFYTGYPILRGAWVSLRMVRPNMDLLIAVAAGSAWLYSIGALVTGSTEVYFDVTMAIVLAVSLGHHYERRIKRGKDNLLARLTQKRIRAARVQRDGTTQEIPIEQLRPGDRVVIRAGEHVPVDGTVAEGEGVVNEALMTGEATPVAKRAGDRVISGTVLTDNALVVQIGEEVTSTLETLIRLMWNIQSGRGGRRRLADRIASWFVPGVLAAGAATFLASWLGGASTTASLLSALAVLIVSCPCALGLATPLALASGIREALRRNIIFKSAAIFEEEAETDIVAFDKTGTLTDGRMRLLDEGDDPEALALARALERYSAHPVARAVAEDDALSNQPGPAEKQPKATGKQPDSAGHHPPEPAAPEVTGVRTASRGISGEVNGRSVYVGQPEWLEEEGFRLTPDHRSKVKKIREKGHVPVGVAWDSAVREILAAGDRLRPESAEIVRELKRRGKKIAVITGDTDAASRPLAEALEPDFLFTGARPESKTEILRSLKKIGRVAMVGDGSNDAPALAESDLGIAFGDPTAIAAESAPVVIPEPRLERVLSAFQAIRLTRLRIRQNLAWAFLYNAVCIPLAVAGLINPLFAALAMAASSLLVVGNSSREMRLD